MKMLSLFTGIGAFEEGLKQKNINYDLIGYSEIDSNVSKAYSIIHNVDEKMNLGDINKINVETLPDFDYMTYGFPCQSFSISGKRKGFDDEVNGNLFFQSMKIASAKKPKFMIGENVEGLLTHDKGDTLKTVLETLDNVGYNTYCEVLNAKDYGSPQNRSRVFLVSIRKDIDKGFNFPKPFLKNKVVADIIENKPRKLMKKNLMSYNDKKFFKKQYISDKGMIKLFDGCQEGYFKSSFIDNRIYSIYGTCPTLTTANNNVFHEINGHLTQRERFKLQGFNPDYADLLLNNGIAKTRIDKMSGNSINVNVIAEIEDELFKQYKHIID